MTDGDRVSGGEARRIEVAVSVFWMAVCTVLGVSVWAFVFDRLSRFVDTGSPWLAGAGLVLLVNAGHYAWGLFTADNDLADLAPEMGLLMITPWERGRIWVRIISLLTVAPSMYLRRALAIWRSRDSGGQ